ncbi:SH3 domain-containing protein [Mesorhizobium sp. ZMM04-5]|uniref:SH3 domain-containing protein n=1 Tax=Mesorhizobium marinum TaxID=3228790 RepID=A0ABV3QXD7_9HYPH
MQRSILLSLFLLVAGTSAYAQDITEKRVHFPAGQSGTTLQGSIKGYEIVDYLLGASAGQRMTIDYETSNLASYFNLLPANSETAIYNASINGNSFDGILPANGDYRIRVYLMRSAARRNETARYTLSVAIHGSAAQAAPAQDPDYADGLSGGPDYWEVHGVPANDTLNVRTAPGTGNPVMGQVANGDRVQNQGCRMSGGQRWCKIRLPGEDGGTGWAAGRYLREAAAPDMVQPTTDEASAEDKKACLAAVRAQTNNSVTVLSSEFSEANSMVMVGVGPNRAPWRCLVSRGRVAEVMSMTDEGAL